jgi:hypothetical protein
MQTLQTDPAAAWIFITDQLNTHQSETLVRRVLSRLSCRSIQELQTRVLACIAYYNRTSNGAFRLPLQRAIHSLLGSRAISA